jgi:O-antigen/teichoic acid export membrane protein
MSNKHSFGKNTAWMSLAASGSSIVSFFIFIVISRLLTPADIGLVAFAMIIFELGKVVINGGFSQIIIQRPDWDNNFSSTCFFLNVAIATIISLIVFFVVAPLSGIYFNAKAEPIIQIFAVLFILEGIKAVHNGKLSREFKFNLIALRVLLASIIPGVIGIYFAYQGYGVWALVIQQGLNQITVVTVTIITANWKPSFTFSKKFALEILSFSAPLMGAQLIRNLGNKLFELLIGLIIGPAALGFYRVAGRVLFIVQEIVTKPFEHTALALLSRMEGKQQQADSVLLIISLSSLLITPIFWGVAAISPTFIVLVFGEKWALSSHLMSVLAIGLSSSIIYIFVNAALMANKQSKMVMNIALVSIVLNLCLAVIFVPFGIMWATIGAAIGTFIVNCLSLFWLRSVLGIPLLKIPQLLFPSYAGSIVMFIAIKFIIPYASVYFSPFFTLVFLCLFGAFTYLIVMVCFFRASSYAALSKVLNASPPKFKPCIRFLMRLSG